MTANIEEQLVTVEGVAAPQVMLEALLKWSSASGKEVALLSNDAEDTSN